jgi:hypothetical protein
LAARAVVVETVNSWALIGFRGSAIRRGKPVMLLARSMGDLEGCELVEGSSIDSESRQVTMLLHVYISSKKQKQKLLKFLERKTPNSGQKSQALLMLVQCLSVCYLFLSEEYILFF